jgi:hypothetical protein
VQEVGKWQFKFAGKLARWLIPGYKLCNTWRTLRARSMGENLMEEGDARYQQDCGTERRRDNRTYEQ